MKSKRLALLAIKYLPLVMSAMMVSHVVLALMGIRLAIAETIGSLTLMPAVIILLVSHAFGFCWLHKQFTLYVFASSVVDGLLPYIWHWLCHRAQNHLPDLGSNVVCASLYSRKNV